MKPHLAPVSAAEARRALLEAAGAAAVGVETVALEDAAGRVLAAPLVAAEDLPAQARAVMDGYAVRAADVVDARADAPVWLAFSGAVTMGEPPARAVGPGEAVAIPTGGVLPDGADAVVMVEQTAREEDRVLVRHPVAAGRNVLRAGGDLPAGATVLGAGRRLRPTDLAALAAFGATRVSVHRRPAVAVLSTGDELCAPHEAPAPGQTRDVNQAVLAAAAEAAGCAVTRVGIVDDDPVALEQELRALLPRHDAILLSGGSSVGGRDHTAEVLAALGAPGVVFHGIDVRPGRPTIFARAHHTAIVGLPGVPTASIVIFEAFVRPMLWRLGGEVGRDPWPSRRRARLAHAHASARGREDWLRVRLVERDGETWAEALPGGSAALSSVLGADGLVRVAADDERVDAGAAVEVCLFV